MMRRMKHTRPVEAPTVWMTIGSAARIWVIAGLKEPRPTLQLSPALWVSLACFVRINYGFAQIAWFGLVRNLSAATSAMRVMAIPMTGTLSAPLVTGEWPRWHDFVAMAFVRMAIAAALLPPHGRPAIPTSPTPTPCTCI